MTKNQAIAHARMFASKWLLFNIRQNLTRIAKGFPSTRTRINLIQRHIEYLDIDIRTEDADKITPYVTPVK